MMRNNAESLDSYEACALRPDRRGFLQHAKLVALGALLGIGVPDGRAFAMRPMTLAALARSRNKVTYPVPPADGVHIDVENRVILARWAKTIYAFSAACPHREGEVEWVEDDERLECTKHNAKFTREGVRISGKSPRNLDRFRISRADDKVVVDTDTIYANDEDPDTWAAAVLGV